MKTRIFSLLTVLIVMASLLGFTFNVQASAYTTSFTTSITYQNVGTGPATIHVDFYANNSGTAIPFDLPSLNALAGSSLYVGTVTSIGSGFNGSAVMSSDEPLAVTLVQNPGTGSGVIGRPLTNGMSSGATFVMIPTVLRNTFGANSVFSVQNASSSNIDATVSFIPTSGTTVTKNITALPAGSGQTFDLGKMTDWDGTGGTFNGSVQIQATGAVVATDLELQTAGVKAYAFEGTAAGATTVYIPSALCNYTATNQNSSYAVQNTNAPGGADVTVTVVYTASGTGTTYTEAPVVIQPGKKASFGGCGVNATPAIPNGFIGSAVVTATGGNIVAIAKIYDNTLGTAFLGFNDASAKVALPYVRWASDLDWPSGLKQRAYIAIQNIGSTDLNAGDVTIKFYDKTGAEVGSYALGALAKNAKASVNPTSAGLSVFGYYPDGSTGGSAIVQGPAGSKLAVIARVISAAGLPKTAGEDYNGIPVQ